MCFLFCVYNVLYFCVQMCIFIFADASNPSLVDASSAIPGISNVPSNSVVNAALSSKFIIKSCIAEEDFDDELCDKITPLPMQTKLHNIEGEDSVSLLTSVTKSSTLRLPPIIRNIGESFNTGVLSNAILSNNLLMDDVLFNIQTDAGHEVKDEKESYKNVGSIIAVDEDEDGEYSFDEKKEDIDMNVNEGSVNSSVSVGSRHSRSSTGSLIPAPPPPPMNDAVEEFKKKSYFVTRGGT